MSQASAILPAIAVVPTPVDAPVPPVAAPAAMTLRSRVMRSSFWTFLGYGGEQVLRLVSNLILTRLLFPEAFGLMALVNVFLQGLQMFSDVGIGPSIIQNKRGEVPDFYNTAWTIQVARGFALWACAAALAWPVSLLYGEPQLLYLLPAAGITAAIGGFNSTAIFTASRQLRLARLTIQNLATQALTLAITVAVASFYPSAWALVLSGICAAVFRMIASHRLDAQIRNRLRWDPESGRALFRFGRWIFISTVLTFFAGQLDRLVFGARIPMDQLGVYAIAVMMAVLPTAAIVRVAGPITFSVYSKIGDDVNRLRPVFRRFRRPLLAAAGWAITTLVLVGPSMIGLLYDDRYLAAGWMMQLLLIAGWFEVMETTNGSALLAMGRPAWLVVSNATKIAGMATFVPLGFWLGSFGGAIVGLVVGEMLRYGVSAIAMHRLRCGALLLDLGATLLVAAGILAAMAARRGLANTGLSAFVSEVLVATTIAALWLPLLYHAIKQRPVGEDNR